MYSLMLEVNHMETNHPMKVLHVLGTLNAGGAESRMMDVYRKIDRRRIQFDFLIFRQDHQHYEDEVLNLGGKIFKLESPSIKRMQNHLKNMRTVMKEGQYNVVHAHTLYHCGLVLYAAYMENIPVRIAHARNSGSARKKNRILVYVGKKMIDRYATCRLAVSALAGEYLFGRHRFEIIPNAIDVEKYAPISGGRMTELRKKYGIPINAIVIGHIGRFDPMKNHEFIIKWFSKYLKTHNAYMILVGAGPLKEEIEQKTVMAGISDRICFTGIINNVHEVVQMFSVLILPSLFEGLPGVVLEAQAAGIPAVVSLPVTDEANMELGLIKKCDFDVDEWTSAVDESIQIERPTQEEIKKAFEKKKFSIDYEIKRLTEIYCGE